MHASRHNGQPDAASIHYLTCLGHELRNSLMPVVMLSDLLSSMVAAGDLVDPAVRESLQTINESGRLASRLVDDLLDFARMKQGEFDFRMEAVDLHDIVRTALHLVEPLMRRRTTLIAVKLEASNSTVRGDRARLLQVVMNVVTNAIKYSPPHGAVAIRTWNPEPGTVAFEVSDHGIGISEGDLPHVFEPFYRAARSDEAIAVESSKENGFGLGLAICEMLVRRHGGVITATSEGPGHGATFQVRIPALIDGGTLSDPAHRSRRTRASHERGSRN